MKGNRWIYKTAYCDGFSKTANSWELTIAVSIVYKIRYKKQKHPVMGCSRQ